MCHGAGLPLLREVGVAGEGDCHGEAFVLQHLRCYCKTRSVKSQEKGSSMATSSSAGNPFPPPLGAGGEGPPERHDRPTGPVKQNARPAGAPPPPPPQAMKSPPPEMAANLLSGQPRQVPQGGRNHPSADQQRNEQPSPPAMLSAEDLLRSIEEGHVRRARPASGWRGLLYEVTGGRYNPGLSAEEVYRAQLVKDIQTNIGGGVKHVAVWAQKGGVGKTTMTVALGVTTAMHRTDKILAIDVNPDGGSLAVRVPSTTRKTILDLRDALRGGYISPNDFDRFVNHAPHRLDSIVMPPGKKAETDHILTGQDYTLISDALEERYPYRMIYTDCGTNLSDSVMTGVISRADQLVIATTTVMDEATVTAGGLDALVREGYGDLVRNAITVIVDKAPRDSNADTQREIESTAEQIKKWFAEMTSEVISAPYDSRIRIGGVFDPSTISSESQLAHLELTRAIVLRLAQQGK